MTNLEYFLKALQEAHEITCLRTWAWDNGVDYKRAHVSMKRAKELYPKNVKISRQANQQGRPLIVRWVG